jgi:hypothetical protein
MIQNRFAWLAISALCVGVAGGCNSGPPMGDVQGTVTVNGQPLSEGIVTFDPVNGDTPSAGGPIRDGKFRVQVPVAKQRVGIVSNVIDREKTPPNASDDQIVMKKLVPDRYNSKSTLTLDVVKGLNEPEYKLTNP